MRLKTTLGNQTINLLVAERGQTLDGVGVGAGKIKLDRVFSGKVQGAPRIVERALVWRWPTRRVDALATNDSPAAVMFIVAGSMNRSSTWQDGRHCLGKRLNDRRLARECKRRIGPGLTRSQARRVSQEKSVVNLLQPFPPVCRPSLRSSSGQSCEAGKLPQDTSKRASCRADTHSSSPTRSISAQICYNFNSMSQPSFQMGSPDELSREELLLRLIERYVMIGGRYYRDIPAEQQAQYLPDVCESESYRCERLRQLLYEHGAFRGVPFRKGPIEVMDAFIAQGPQRLAAERETARQCRRRRANAEPTSCTAKRAGT